MRRNCYLTWEAEIKIEGLEEMQRKLRELELRVRRLNGEHDVAIDDLLTPEFMALHTRLPSFVEMIQASAWDVSSQEDFEAIPDEPWDKFVSETTDFDDWQGMLSAAMQEWAARELGL